MAELEKLKALIAAQQKQLEELSLQLELLSRRLQEMEQKAAGPTPAGAPEAQVKGPEPSLTERPEDPPSISAADFPGSIRIPGTDSAIRFGGMIWVTLVETLDPLGSTDQFLTYSIPVGETGSAGQDNRLSIWAGPSRFNIDYRTSTSLGQMRAFIEGDFAGEPGSYFRLRHAFSQFRGFLVGQTWSTFADPDADHEDIDFEGINAENVLRQPQIRYTWHPKKHLKVAVAIENPEASISGGQAVDQIPDFIGRVVSTWDGGGHIQGALVVGDLRGQPDNDPNETASVFSYGGSVSTVIPFRGWSRKDRVIFQANGGVGVAHYINDLNGAGGQDGVFDPDTDTLYALSEYAFYVDYEHHWNPSWNLLKGARLKDLRSSLIWGYVHVRNLDFQPGDAYHVTNRISLNLLWTPIPRLDVGVEYIWGSRENKDGEKGTARQIQIRSRFLF